MASTPADPSPSCSPRREPEDGAAWIHDLALRWRLVRPYAALTPPQIDQQHLMLRAWLTGSDYRGPSSLAVGDLAQTAELMPYLTGSTPVPQLTPAGTAFRKYGRL